MIGIKIVFGIVLGYLTILLHGLIFKKKNQSEAHLVKNIESHEHKHEDDEHEEHEHGNNNHEHEDDEHHNMETENIEQDLHGGCCHHHVQTKSFDWLHPMLHCIKIGIFILVINILFGFITHIWVGEQGLMSFLNQSKNFQPVLAVLIGLIPNCASSVILAQLYINNSISFGAILAGLIVNAGLGMVFLFRGKEKASVKFTILFTLISISLVVGYITNLILGF